MNKIKISLILLVLITIGFALKIPYIPILDKLFNFNFLQNLFFIFVGILIYFFQERAKKLLERLFCL